MAGRALETSASITLGTTRGYPAALPTANITIPAAIPRFQDSYNLQSQSTMIEPVSSTALVLGGMNIAGAVHSPSMSLGHQIERLQNEIVHSTQLQYLQLNNQESHQTAQMTRMMEIHQAQMEKLVELVQLQADSKARDEETQRMIRQVNDHLITVRQKVDAILVQNYELHEYPIPRLFVILPIAEIGGSGSFVSSSLPNWVPRFTEKFRLFFLCECGEHSKADSGENGKPVDNNTHLAAHEGYELSRPTVFFERYGPYLLGMLQILKTCLMATTIVAPAVGHLNQGIDQVTGSVRSTAENTVRAVDFSIQFLETKLNTAGGDVESNNYTAIEGNHFKDLRALEGADLRKLDTFLKNKDKDKILGNLYRITTKEGHVKWVCLSHYRSSYREAAMKSFLQVVELNQGQYDPQLQKVTIQLHSSITASEFFAQLERAPSVNEIEIVFRWDFNLSDLKQMVLAIQKSNIRYCAVDLNDFKDRDINERLLGRGRYEPLLELLSTTKIQSFRLLGVSSFSKRSSNFSKGMVCSTLTRFEYAAEVQPEDQPRFANILRSCPQMIVLRLGQVFFPTFVESELTDAIVQLQNLEVLHLFNFNGKFSSAIKGFLCAFPKTQKLREVVLKEGQYDASDLHELICAMASHLERLVVNLDKFDGIHFARLFPNDFGSRTRSGKNADPTPFKNLSRMCVDVAASPQSVLHFIGNMGLTQLSVNCVKDAWSTLHYLDFSSLRSLHLDKCNDIDLDPIWRSFPENGGSGQIESLSLNPVQNLPSAVYQLTRISLCSLWIYGKNVSIEWLKSLFQSLNVSRLTILGLSNSWDDTVFSKLPRAISPQLRVYVEKNFGLTELRLLPGEERLVVQLESRREFTRFDLLGF